MQINTIKRHKIIHRARQAGVIGLTILALTACKTGVETTSDNHKHEAITEGSYTYLALYDKDNKQIKMLDSKQGEVAYQFALTGSEPSLYASPDSRYAVIAQRSDNTVRFLDSGVYAENHGDHWHPYKIKPKFTEQTITKTAPTHYTVHADHAVIFHDGSGDVASSISVISDTSIKKNMVVASLDRDNNMHGVAKLVDDTLLITRRDPSITETTLPSEVERYYFDGQSFVFEHRYEMKCPSLHGAAAGAQYAVFGCGNGILAIKLQSDTNEVQHRDNPKSLAAGARIGTILAHNQLEQFVGFSSTQSQLFVIDLAANELYQELQLPNLVKPQIYGFDTSGDLFYVLGGDGVLYLFNTQTWQITATIPVMDALASNAVKPSIAVSKLESQLYVLAPEAKMIRVVDLKTTSVTKTISLNFLATKMVWVGLSQPVSNATH